MEDARTGPFGQSARPRDSPAAGIPGTIRQGSCSCMTPTHTIHITEKSSCGPPNRDLGWVFCPNRAPPPHRPVKQPIMHSVESAAALPLLRVIRPLFPSWIRAPYPPPPVTDPSLRSRTLRKSSRRPLREKSQSLIHLIAFRSTQQSFLALARRAIHNSSNSSNNNNGLLFPDN